MNLFESIYFVKEQITLTFVNNYLIMVQYGKIRVKKTNPFRKKYNIGQLNVTFIRFKKFALQISALKRKLVSHKRQKHSKRRNWIMTTNSAD